MKKMLSLLGAVGLTTLGGANVIACGNTPDDNSDANEVQTLALKGSYTSGEGKNVTTQSYDYIDKKIEGGLVMDMVCDLINYDGIKKTMDTYLASVGKTEEDVNNENVKFNQIFGGIGFIDHFIDDKDDLPDWYYENFYLKNARFF